MKKSIFVTLALTMLALTVRGAEPRFTMDDIVAGKFTEKSVTGLRPMADGEHYAVRNGNRIESYRYQDGQAAEVLFDADEDSLWIEMVDYQLSADASKILLTTNTKPIYRHSFSADYYVWDRTGRTLTRLTTDGAEQQAAFSPDGSKVGFVRHNDLYVVELSDFSLRRITTDGVRNAIINGLPDWVYEEEYAISRAFEFSPDSRQIAWLRFDETQVREFTMMTYAGELYPKPYTYKYPKAGEKNAEVSLHVCNLESNVISRIDTGVEECYLPLIGFTPQGELWFHRVNRLQNRFEVILAGQDGALRSVYSETSARYVERPDKHTLTFTGDGDFVVVNESSGFRHIYYYKLTKKGTYTRHNAITHGEWDVERIVGIADGQVWYLSGERSPIRRDLYCVRLDGKNKRCLTSVAGSYKIAPGRDMKYYVAYFSNATTPLQVSVHRGDGTLLRMLQDNAAVAETLKELNFPIKEFFSITTTEGVRLNAYMLKPEGFDPAKRYPVLMTQYSGPDSQQVLDRWKIDWEDVMVQYGYVVVCVDGRGTGMRGEEFRKCTYGNLGALEVQDQIAAARWLADQSWVDAARIGIYGWSYGGFMALNCILKGADVFRMAIAVAPVTSWRFYDSIYTEIYNGLPQDNPAGYDNNSPLTHTDLLRGKLLIVHGTSDDNVHIQNSYEMASALTRAGKQFDMMIYPDCNHSMRPSGGDNVRQKMVDYTLENL